MILNGSLGRRNQQEATLLVLLDGPVAEPPEDFFTIHEGFDLIGHMGVEGSSRNATGYHCHDLFIISRIGNHSR